MFNIHSPIVVVLQFGNGSYGRLWASSVVLANSDYSVQTGELGAQTTVL